MNIKNIDHEIRLFYLNEDIDKAIASISYLEMEAFNNAMSELDEDLSIMTDEDKKACEELDKGDFTGLNPEITELIKNIQKR